MKKQFVILFSLGFLLTGCRDGQEEIVSLQGEAQGSTYHIKYIGTVSYEFSVDSLFREIDSSLSGYLPTSLLSLFNNSDSAAQADEHIRNVFIGSAQVWKESNGAFDPTVMPLVRFWGFAGNSIAPPDSISHQSLDSLKEFIGFGHVQLGCLSGESFSGDTSFRCGEGYMLTKDKSGVALDFNAIAQGYTVDVIAEFLESRHIANYLVEVGGEVRASGLSGKGKPWRVGIDKPLSDVDPKRPLQAVLNIGNASLATSGNYRKYYIKNGVKYAHTIDPATGYPVQHSLLSATVLAPDCMTADAWATAFMVMGIENARAVLARHSGLQAFLIYSGKNGDMESWCSDGLRALLDETTEGSQ